MTDPTPEYDEQEQRNWEAAIDAEFEKEKQWEDEQRWIDWGDDD